MESYLDLGKSGKSAWWRYVVGLAVVILLPFLLGIFIYACILLASFGGKPLQVDPSTGFPKGIDPMVNYVGLHASFVLLIPTIYAVVRFLHGRPFLSLITPKQKLNWQRLKFAFRVWLVLSTFFAISGYLLFPKTYEFALDSPKFFYALPVVLILTPIQTCAEEFLFRGYLLQALGLRIRNIWILAIVSSIIFMIPHLWNPEVKAGLAYMVLYYFAIGFLFSFVTLWSNSLEIALGAHTAINLFTALIVNYKISAVTTRSIFICSEIHPLYELLAIIVTGLIFVLLTVRFVSQEGKS